MIKEYTFNIELYNNHTAKCREVVEIEFEGNETEEEINKIVEGEYNIWLSNNCDMGWWIK